MHEIENRIGDCDLMYHELVDTLSSQDINFMIDKMEHCHTIIQRYMKNKEIKQSVILRFIYWLFKKERYINIEERYKELQDDSDFIKILNKKMCRIESYHNQLKSSLIETKTMIDKDIVLNLECGRLSTHLYEQREHVKSRLNLIDDIYLDIKTKRERVDYVLNRICRSDYPPPLKPRITYY